EQENYSKDYCYEHDDDIKPWLGWHTVYQVGIQRQKTHECNQHLQAKHRKTVETLKGSLGNQVERVAKCCEQAISEFRGRVQTDKYATGRAQRYCQPLERGETFFQNEASQHGSDHGTNQVRERRRLDVDAVHNINEQQPIDPEQKGARNRKPDSFSALPAVELLEPPDVILQRLSSRNADNKAKCDQRKQ